MQNKGVVDAVPAKKMSDRVGKRSVEVDEILEDIKGYNTGDVVEYSFTRKLVGAELVDCEVEDCDDVARDGKRASVRAVALRKLNINATTRGTSVFVTV